MKRPTRAAEILSRGAVNEVIQSTRGRFVVEISSRAKRGTIEQIKRYHVKSDLTLKLGTEMRGRISFTLGGVALQVGRRGATVRRSDHSWLAGSIGVSDGIGIAEGSLFKGPARTASELPSMRFTIGLLLATGSVELLSEPQQWRLKGYEPIVAVRVLYLGTLKGVIAGGTGPCDIKEGTIWDYYCEGVCGNPAKSCQMQSRPTGGVGAWTDLNITELWKKAAKTDYRCHCY